MLFVLSVSIILSLCLCACSTQSEVAQTKEQIANSDIGGFYNTPQNMVDNCASRSRCPWGIPLSAHRDGECSSAYSVVSESFQLRKCAVYGVRSSLVLHNSKDGQSRFGYSFCSEYPHELWRLPFCISFYRQPNYAEVYSLLHNACAFAEWNVSNDTVRLIYRAIVSGSSFSSVTTSKELEKYGLQNAFILREGSLEPIFENAEDVSFWRDVKLIMPNMTENDSLLIQKSITEMDSLFYGEKILDSEFDNIVQLYGDDDWWKSE